MLNNYLFPLTILGIFMYSLFKKNDSYHSFLEGSKDGLLIFIHIFPTMLAMSLAINLLRSSNILDYISMLIAKIFHAIPPSVVPMLLFRPFSGSATMALLVDIFKIDGVDSLAGIMGSIIQGSTDTTLYVISLYFSHVGVKNIKNSLKIGLIADVAGMGMGILLTLLFINA